MTNFTSKRIRGLIFRMGALNLGTLKEIRFNRVKFYKPTTDQKNQYTKIDVIINNELYTITEIFPYKENAESAKHPPRVGLPKIILYYTIQKAPKGAKGAKWQ